MLNFKKSITVIALSFLICRSGFTGETELLISAASSTTDVLKALIAQFEEYNPDVRITTNFAGSGTLLRQIERGAPVDLFFSADQLTMAQAVQQGTPTPKKKSVGAPQIERTDQGRLKTDSPVAEPTCQFCRFFKGHAGQRRIGHAMRHPHQIIIIFLKAVSLAQNVGWRFMHGAQIARDNAFARLRTAGASRKARLFGRFGRASDVLSEGLKNETLLFTRRPKITIKSP